MKICLIKLEDQGNQNLFRQIFSAAHQNRLGIIKNSKILFTYEEYASTVQNLAPIFAMPKELGHIQKIEWVSRMTEKLVKNPYKFTHIYLYP